MKEIITIEIDTGKSSQNLASLRKNLKEQKEELEKIAIGTDAFKKLQESIKGTERTISQLEKGVKQYRDEDVKWEKQMILNSQRINEVSVQIVKLKQENSGLANQNKILTKQYEDGQISINAYTEELASNNSLIESNKIAVSNLTREQKGLIKETEAIPTTMEQMALSLGNLKSRYRALTEEERNSPFGKQLNEQISSLDEELKTLDSQIGNNQRNVGNYPSVMGGAGESIKNVGGQVIKFAGALGLVVGAGKLFTAGLQSMRTGSQEFGDKITQVMVGGKEATDAFFRAIVNGDWSNLLDNMRSAYQEGKRYAEMMDLIQDKQRAENITIANIDKEIAKNEELLKDKTNSAKVREKALNDINALEKSKLDMRISLLDEEMQNQDTHLQNMYGITMKEYEKMFGDVNSQQAMFDAGKLEAKMKADDRYWEYVYTKEGVQHKQFNNMLYEEDLKSLDKRTRIAIHYNRLQNKISDEERDKSAEILTKKSKAEEEYYKGIGRLAEKKVSVQMQFLAQEKEAIDNANKAREKEISFEKEKLKLINEANALQGQGLDLSSRIAQLEQTWELEKKLLKEGSDEYILAEMQKNNELLKLKKEYSEQQKALDKQFAEEDKARRFKALRDETAQLELELKQRYANELMSEAEYNEASKQLKVERMIAEIAILETEQGMKAELQAKELELENYLADQRIALNQKEADEKEKTTIAQQERMRATLQDIEGVVASTTANLFDTIGKGEEALLQSAKNSLATVLDMLEKQVLASTVSAQIQSMAMPDAVATFGVAGIIRATIIAGLIRGAFAGVKAKLMQPPKYAEGGLIGGRPHSQGGTLINAERGEAIMKVEAVKRFAPQLSAMNQSVGGAPIMANGGMVGGSLYQTGLGLEAEKQEMNNQLMIKAMMSIRPVVSVEEISTKSNELNRINQVSVL